MRNDERGKKEGIDVAAASIAGCAGADADCPALHQSKNLIYEKLKCGELPYYPVNGKYLVAKADLIEYIIEHGDEGGNGRFKIGGGNGGQ